MTPRLATQVNARFARRLRTAREARGLSRFELEDMVGLPRNAVEVIERGRVGAARRRVDIGEAVALCEALGVPLSAMIREQELDLSALTERSAS